MNSLERPRKNFWMVYVFMIFHGRVVFFIIFRWLAKEIWPSSIAKLSAKVQWYLFYKLILINHKTTFLTIFFFICLSAENFASETFIIKITTTSEFKMAMNVTVVGVSQSYYPHLPLNVTNHVMAIHLKSVAVFGEWMFIKEALTIHQ